MGAKHSERRPVATRASGESDAAPGVAMSLEQAQEILKVNSTDGFETIMDAKNKQLARVHGDQEKTFMIEAAYDVLLMQRMKQRLSGETKVSNTVRFADVPVKKPTKQAQPSMLSQLPNGSVRIALPPRDEALQQGACFAALALWSYVQAATEPPVVQLADVAGLQQSLALLFAIYVLKEKKRLNIWRSVGYSLAGLIVGSVLGGALQSWLRVDIVPILGVGSPGVFTAEFGILGVAAAALLLA